MNAEEAKAVALAALEGLDGETLGDAARCNLLIADAITSDPRYDPERDHLACWLDRRDGRRELEVRGFETREDAQQWLSEQVLATAFKGNLGDFVPRCFDRAGKPIGFAEFARLMEEPDYYRVALDHLYGFRVSTVWLGIDHSFRGDGRDPVVFETMVFDDLGKDRTGEFEVMERYTTEADARAGHLLMVEAVRNHAEASMRPPG